MDRRSTPVDAAWRSGHCMRAGKHVICEKPFTGDFGRADDRAPIGQHMPKALM